MTKDEAFLASLRSVGDGVTIFAGALLLRPELIAVGEGSRIDDFTRIEGGQGVEIGRYVHISSFCSIFAGGRALVGDYACMAEGSRILTGSEQLDAAMSSVAPTEWRRVETGTSILDHLAFLATNAVMMPGVVVGVGAVVGAGSVATRDVPPWEVWAGRAGPEDRRARSGAVAGARRTGGRPDRGRTERSVTSDAESPGEALEFLPWPRSSVSWGRRDRSRDDRAIRTAAHLFPLWFAATGLLAWIGRPRGALSWRRPHPATVVLVGIVSVATALNVSSSAAHVVTDRDPGVYTVSGRWLARGGSIDVPGIAATPFGREPTVAIATPVAFAPVADLTGDLRLFRPAAWPAMLGAAQLAGGDAAMFIIPALLAALALGFYAALATRMGGRWFGAVAVAALCANLAEIYVWRDTFAEVPTQVLLLGALLVLLIALRNGHRGRAAIAGSAVGAAAAIHFPALLLLPACCVRRPRSVARRRLGE